MPKIDPKKAKAAKRVEEKPTEKLLVEKADGSVGPWGQPRVPVKQTYRTYPKGEITQDDVDYVKSLNDPKLNKVASNTGKARDWHTPGYGPEDSDVMRAVLAKRSKKAKK